MARSMVKGTIVAPAGEAIRLCSALLESDPPQCGGSSLVVEGLDLSTVEGLTETNDPSLAQVQWSETRGLAARNRRGRHAHGEHDLHVTGRRGPAEAAY